MASTQELDTEVDGVLAGRRVLVTGASGFIGRHLVCRLDALGAQVFAVSRSAPTCARLSAQWIRADLLDEKAPCEIVKSIRPDFVFHLASKVTGHRELGLVLPTMQANLCATVNLLCALAELDAPRVVLAGSVEEPGPHEGLIPASSPYAIAKWASTAYARTFHDLFGLPTVVLRLAMVYGPGVQNGRRLIPYLINSLLRAEPPALTSGNRQIDWVYIDDVVDAFLAAACAADAGGRILDVGSGEPVSIRDTVKLLTRVLGSGIEPRFGAIQDRPFDSARIADLDATAAVLGWRPNVSLEEGLRRTIAWHEQHSRLGPAEVER